MQELGTRMSRAVVTVMCARINVLQATIYCTISMGGRDRERGRGGGGRREREREREQYHPLPSIFSYTTPVFLQPPRSSLVAVPKAALHGNYRTHVLDM